MEFSGNPPLTLYLHLPWCVRKCPYCDFNSHEAPETLPIDAYVDALKADLEQEVMDTWGRPLTAIFIGGGTPSLFPPEAIAHLLSHVRALFNPDPMIEITLEANPGTLETGRFEAFRRAGINRLSLGVQSFNDAMLQQLGRIHGAEESHAAVEAARAAGFDSVNIDLMYALPGQGTRAAMADLDAALAYGVDHVSWYQLTLEPNTVFWSRPPASLPDDDAIADIEDAGHARLTSAGYARYEISAWARSADTRCHHNLNYWQFGDYLGVGAGAHGKITLPVRGAIERRAKVRAPQAYIDRAAAEDRIADRRQLSAADAALEFMLNALRLPEGFAPALFQERTGVPLAWLEGVITRAIDDELLARTAERIHPTSRGLRYLNELLQRFESETARWQHGREALARIPIVPRGIA